jgi:transcriptional regulator with XRE-family HTH domain
MANPMFEERTYERKQEIEVRAARGNNVNTWVKARIEQKTSKGAYVTILHSNRYVHLAFRDMRHIGSNTGSEVVAEAPAPVAATTTKLSNPVLSKENIDKVVKRMLPMPNLPEAPSQPPPIAPISQPMATVTPIRQAVEEVPDVIMENAQRLVNVSKSRTPKVRTSNPLLAALLRNARELEHFAQKDVGELVGVGQVMVSRFERAEIAPDDDVLLAYHEKLGMDLDLLILARDKPDEARNYKPKPQPNAAKEPALTPTTPPMEPSKPVEPLAPPVVQKPTAALVMDDFFEFCDKMEFICPQPTDPALRKQWRELAKGMFELRSKL